MRLGLSKDDGFDRFCFPATGGRQATVRAARRTAFARLIGGTSASARVGVDHSRLARVVLTAGRKR